MSKSIKIEKEPSSSLTGKSRAECWAACVTDTSCSTFFYSLNSGVCQLFSEDGLAFGSGALVGTESDLDEFYQSLCIYSERLCNVTASFDRYPQNILVGHSEHVITTKDGLPECLKVCLESRQRYNMDCRSVMFNSQNNECILNRATKDDYPDLFSSNLNENTIDYFENNCLDGTCNGKKENLFWIKSEYFVPFNDTNNYVIYEDSTSDRCLQACRENELMIEEGYECRSLIYSSNTKECHLSRKTSLTTDKKIKKSQHTGPLDLSGLETMSSGYYLEKICLKNSVKCLEDAFEVVPNHYLNVTGEMINTSSLSTCLNACMKWSRTCISVSFFKQTNECVLNEKSRFSHGSAFVKSIDADYYDNVCETDQTNKHLVPPNAVDYLKEGEIERINKFTISQKGNSMENEIIDKYFEKRKGIKDLEPEIVTKDDKIASFTSHSKANKIPSDDIKLDGPLVTECKSSGIKIEANFLDKTEGVMYIKDHSKNCKSSFTNALSTTLKIPYPVNDEVDPVCPGFEETPGVWHYLVILQRKSEEIEGIVSSIGRTFKITCDYSKSVEHNQIMSSATLNSPSIDDRQLITDNDIAKFHMGLYLQNKPVTTVSLGDEVEIRWEMQHTTKKRLGYSIDECVAERLEGLPPQPPPLQLFTNGCPDPKVKDHLVTQSIKPIENGFSTLIKIFRFEGSRKCVVCGERACSHFYYGVASCHGCKCFFWRTVKTGAVYTCRYDKKCNISTRGRNICRYCRFDRCLAVGMQKDAVRLSKKKLATKDKKSSENHMDEIQEPKIKMESNPFSLYKDSYAESDGEKTYYGGEIKIQEKEDDSKYLETLLKVHQAITYGGDLDETKEMNTLLSMKNVFDYPHLLQTYRQKVDYRVKLQIAGTEEINFCARKMLTIAIDWIQRISPNQKTHNIDNAIKILRNSFSSLTILDIVYNSTKVTKDENLLCLPNGITLLKNEALAPNILFNNDIVSGMLENLAPLIQQLNISETEFVILKGLIVYQTFTKGINKETAKLMECYKEKLQNLLYNECRYEESDPMKVATRFASLLSIFPTISLLARDIIDHIKIYQSFGVHTPDILFIELFGDIFSMPTKNVVKTKFMETSHNVNVSQVEIGVS
uniref:Nuclear receptor domain-containing protein n=1 Tax=Rhabditophanes sp. KR3021 TaxID=114890 RepID=A0AC35U8I3_9BILA